MRVLDAPALARAFTLNLDELWERGNVEHTGRVELWPVNVGDGIEARAWFTPEYGDALSHRVAKFLGLVRKRSGNRVPRAHIRPETRDAGRGRERAPLRRRGGDRRDAGRRGVPPVGMNGVSAWKIPLLNNILTVAPFSGKPTTRWTPESTHDFMHAKVVVADDVSFVGSFNFSRSGEKNAENVLELHDAGPRTGSRPSWTRCAAAVPADDAAPHRGTKRVREVCRHHPGEERPRVPARHCDRGGRRRDGSGGPPSAPRRGARCSPPTTRGIAASTGCPWRPGRRDRGGDRPDEDTPSRLRLGALGRWADRDPVHGRRQEASQEQGPRSSTRTSPTAGRIRSPPACRSRAAPPRTATATP